jgi:hypothetical protein
MIRKPRPSLADLTAEAIHAALCKTGAPLPSIDSAHGRSDRVAAARFLDVLHAHGQAIRPLEGAAVLSTDFLALV